MNNKRDLDQAKLFALFKAQEKPFDFTLAAKTEYWSALKRISHEKTIEHEQVVPSKYTTKINGFMVSEALLALLICAISGFLLLSSISALSKAMQMNVQSEMDVDFDLDIAPYDQDL